MSLVLLLFVVISSRNSKKNNNSSDNSCSSNSSNNISSSSSRNSSSSSGSRSSSSGGNQSIIDMIILTKCSRSSSTGFCGAGPKLKRYRVSDLIHELFQLVRIETKSMTGSMCSVVLPCQNICPTVVLTGVDILKKGCTSLFTWVGTKPVREYVITAVRNPRRDVKNKLSLHIYLGNRSQLVKSVPMKLFCYQSFN